MLSEIDAEIVYVGYGIEAPEYNWEDYKGAERPGRHAANDLFMIEDFFKVWR